MTRTYRPRCSGRLRNLLFLNCVVRFGRFYAHNSQDSAPRYEFAAAVGFLLYRDAIRAYLVQVKQFDAGFRLARSHSVKTLSRSMSGPVMYVISSRSPNQALRIGGLISGPRSIFAPTGRLY
jgi:hypothetical protein